WGLMVQHSLRAINPVVIALVACFAYFCATNLLLDRLLTSDRVTRNAIIRPDGARSRIRSWLFVGAALLFVTVYLVYPVFETLRLSFYDKYGQKFVGFDNYTWAFTDSVFWQSALNNLGWLVIVPALATSLGLIIAVLADRVWWGNIA